MGGIRTNKFGHSKLEGLFAAGEAACVSVHGANRLGSNSLLDLVVFGRAAAIRAAEMIKPGVAKPAIKNMHIEESLQRFDNIRYSKGKHSTAHIRKEMQGIMQKDAAVFRTEKPLANGVKDMSKTLADHFNDLHIEHAPFEPEVLSFWRLLSSTAVLNKTENITCPNAIRICGALSTLHSLVLWALALCLVRGEHHIGRDEECPVLSRRHHVVCHVPHPVVQRPPLRGQGCR